MIKRILIVNCYFDDLRTTVRRQLKIPQAMGPAFLAGAFSPHRCDIKLYNEQFSGPLENERLLASPDMLVLTGLNTAFDRMRHVTAYARTKNKKIIVVAGGPAVRALPRYSALFFDYCCTGDVEQLKDVIIDAFGPAYVSAELMEEGWATPRYDLAYWMKIGGYVESSRNCYYNCSFCSLTAEHQAYRQYDMAYLRRQFSALGRRSQILFIDNNFGGTSRRFLINRFDLLKNLKGEGRLKSWSAMVSAEFFTSAENLTRAREAGCIGLFSGVESFDSRSLLNYQKLQNIRSSQIELIRRCLESGIIFFYGLLLDASQRRLADLKAEIDFILDTPEIPLPSYISFAIPMLKTPLFNEAVKNERLLPGIKIRDLDSATLTVKPVDPLPKVAAFIRDLQVFSGYRRKAFRHLREFHRLYRKYIPFENRVFLINGAMLLYLPQLLTTGPDILRLKLGRHHRTYVGTTESLDNCYKPAFPINGRYKGHFSPTMLTDEKGNLNDALLPDLFDNHADAKKADRPLHTESLRAAGAQPF